VINMIDPLTIYTICFVAGFIFLLITFLLGMFGDISGADSDASGGDYDASGADSDTQAGDIHHEISAAEAAVISPLSPTIIALTLTCFGAFGVILTIMDVQDLFVPAISIFVSLGISAVMYLALNHFLGKAQATSTIKIDELVGTIGEVTTPIPQDGLGVVALIAKGSRISYSAKSSMPIKAGVSVRVKRISAQVLFVEPIDEENTEEKTVSETTQSSQENQPNPTQSKVTTHSFSKSKDTETELKSQAVVTEVAFEKVKKRN